MFSEVVNRLIISLYSSIFMIAVWVMFDSVHVLYLVRRAAPSRFQIVVSRIISLAIALSLFVQLYFRIRGET